MRGSGLASPFGSLAPNGAIIKRSAADPRLFERTGRAVVFSSLADLAERLDSPDLDVTADDFMVLQNAGPRSSSGKPDAGYLPIPAKLAKAVCCCNWAVSWRRATALPGPCQPTKCQRGQAPGSLMRFGTGRGAA